MNSPKCLICDSTSDFLIEKDGYDHYRCPECKLIFVHPQPDQKFLAEEVYSEKSGYQGNKKNDLANAKPVDKQSLVLSYLKKGNGGRFLDIGSSSGEMLYWVKKLGYEVQGVELNPRTAAIAKENGLNVFVGALENANFKNESFDVIFMGDLIEHVKDPAALLMTAKKLLKKSGELIILTPNFDCYWSRATFGLWKTFRIPWSMLTPPHHLFNFSTGNLSKLLRQNGFNVKKEWYTGAPTLKYELGSLHLLKRWKQNKTGGNLLYMGFAFGLYSLLHVVNKFMVEPMSKKRFGMTLVCDIV